MTHKRVLLVGCGSEIGSNLLLANDPEADGFCIDTVINRSVSDSHHRSIDTMYARLVLASPQFIDRIQIISPDEIGIDDRVIRFVWGDIDGSCNFEHIGLFDFCILATSKAHIASEDVTKKLALIATYVFGVAENVLIPAAYPALADCSVNTLQPECGASVGLYDGIYALGSCQSNGWLAAYRTVIDCLLPLAKINVSDIVGHEIDIVHPDTPTGNLGTLSINPRHQDPRDNLRPSESQVHSTMARLYPSKHSLNTVSLRTLVHPPGYQICRFYFKGCAPLDAGIISEAISLYASTSPIVGAIKMPLGSMALRYSKKSSVILCGQSYLFWNQDPFRMQRRERVSQLIIQQYVSNTHGYCYSVLRLLRLISNSEEILICKAKK